MQEINLCWVLNYRQSPLQQGLLFSIKVYSTLRPRDRTQSWSWRLSWEMSPNRSCHRDRARQRPLIGPLKCHRLGRLRSFRWQRVTFDFDPKPTKICQKISSSKPWRFQLMVRSTRKIKLSGKWQHVLATLKISFCLRLDWKEEFLCASVWLVCFLSGKCEQTCRNLTNLM